MKNKTTEIKRESVIPTGFRSGKESYTALFTADGKAYTIESAFPPTYELVKRLYSFGDLLSEFWGLTGSENARLKVTGYDSDGTYVKLFGEINHPAHGIVKFSTPKMPFADDGKMDLAKSDPDMKRKYPHLLFNEEYVMLEQLEAEVTNFIMGDRGEMEEDDPDLPFDAEEEENLLDEEN